MSLKVARTLVVAAGMSALSVACYVDASSSTPASAASGGGAAPAGSGTGAPMLVQVDTGKKMEADPGQGVGVFVEYASGGLWHVWWTCDTLRTRESCAFDLTLTSASSDIADVASEGFTPRDVLAKPSAKQLQAVTLTSTQVSGVTFRTAPRDIVTLEASVSGLKDDAFLFFVQDGKVNGGHKGALSNPLQLQGASP